MKAAAGETVFIGTSHIDPDGYARLSRVLECRRPGLVLLEVSPMSIILRRTYGLICRMILRRSLKILKPEINSEIRGIMSYLDIPYEYTAVRDYCRRSGASYRLVDVSLISLARFFHAYKLVSVKNISAAAGYHGDRFMQERGTAAAIFGRNDRLLLSMKLSQFRGDPLAVRREAILLRRVIRHTKRNRSRNVMYIGGWEHLMDAPGSGLLYPESGLRGKRLIIFLDNFELNPCGRPGIT